MPQTPAALSGGHPHTPEAGNFNGVAPQKEATGRTRDEYTDYMYVCICKAYPLPKVWRFRMGIGWCYDSRKHLARLRTSASRGRQGALWHGAATRAGAKLGVDSGL